MLSSYSEGARRFLWAEVAEQPVKTAVFLVMSTISAALEVMGIALIFPLLYIIIEPDSFSRFGFLVWLMEVLGIESQKALHLFLIGAIAFILVAKNVYMGVFNHVQLKLLAARKSRLSRRLMRIYMYSDFSIHMHKTSSEIIRNIGLTSMIYDQFILSWIRILTNSVVTVSLLGLLVTVLPAQAVLATCVLGTAALALHYGLKSWFVRLGRQSNEIFKRRQRLLQQSIGAVKDTKILGKENYFVTHFGAVDKENFDNQRVSTFLALLPVLVSESVAILAVLALISYVVFFATERTEILATLGILAATMFRIAPQLNRMLSSFQLVELSRHGLETVTSELETFERGLYVPPENVSRLPLERALTLENVSYAYPGGEGVAVEDVSFEVGKNQFVGITGGSGAGKSTVLSILMGLLEPSQGQVLVDGVALSTPERLRQWQSSIGYVPQDVFLTEESIKQNIAFGVEVEQIDDQRLAEAVRLASLDGYVASAPHGLEENVGENGSRLSGGERQRVGIARALYVEPSFLAFDEATSSLDVRTERFVAEQILAFRGQRTIVAVAHRLSTLRDCDKIVMMHEGRVIDVGSFDELETRCERFRHLVELSRLAQLQVSVGES